MLIQLDLFETTQESENRTVIEAIDKIQSSLTKQRKSQFAKIGEIKKLILEVDARLQVIERNICRKEDGEV